MIAAAWVATMKTTAAHVRAVPRRHLSALLAQLEAMAAIELEARRDFARSCAMLGAKPDAASIVRRCEAIWRNGD